MNSDNKLSFIPERYIALASEYPKLSICRVVSQQKGQYTIISNAGEQRASVSGRLQHEAKTVSEYPTVGDYVMAELNYPGAAVIRHLLPRKGVFMRKAAGTARTEQPVAANIDTVFLCMSLNNDFNLRRLERYLSIAWDSGAKPVVVFTKADLCMDIEHKLSQAQSVAIGADIVVTSAMDNDGYASIMPYIKEGVTVAFVGSSGVGKSMLINKLLGEERLATNGLRNDDKGRHTTTHRELIALPCGAMVIDTPGMRELGMWDSAEGVSVAFADIEELASRCRFRNCTHTREPGCAVRAALQSGELNGERFDSYKKLLAENAYAGDSDSYAIAKQKKFKEIAKFNKSNRKQ